MVKVMLVWMRWGMMRGRGWLRLWLWGGIDQQKGGVGGGAMMTVIAEVDANGEEQVIGSQE